MIIFENRKIIRKIVFNLHVWEKSLSTDIQKKPTKYQEHLKGKMVADMTCMLIFLWAWYCEKYLTSLTSFKKSKIISIILQEIIWRLEIIYDTFHGRKYNFSTRPHHTGAFYFWKNQTTEHTKANCSFLKDSTQRQHKLL